MFYSKHRTATDRRWATSHSTTLPVRNRTPLTARYSSLRCVSAAEHHTVEQYSKTGRTKPRKHLPRCDLSWPGLPQDTKSLRTCSRNQVKMLLNGHFGIKCHWQYIKVTDSISTVPTMVSWGYWRCIVCDLERSHHSLTLPKVTDQRLCYCISNIWGRQNNNQSIVNSITDQLFFIREKSSEVYRKNNNGPKTLP